MSNKPSKEESKCTHGDAVEQLRTMGRFIDVVPPDGNCMFESIARQMKGNTLVTAQTIRESVYKVGKEQFERFIDFYEGDNDLYFEDLERLRQDGTWDVAIGDLALSIAQVALDVPIIVIRSFNPPLMFPDNATSTSDDIVVIVQNGSQTHYDATKTFSKGWDNGLAISQMRAMHRNRVPMAKNGNSFFNAVFDQLPNKKLTANNLRQLVCTSLESYPEGFLPSHSSPAKTEKFLAAARLLRGDFSWGPSMKIPVMMALADGLEKQIVILADYTDPIIYPANEDQISEDVIVLIQDRTGSHYDSTNLREQGDGSAVDQMRKLNRRIVPMPEDGNSFFNAVADQLKDKNLTAQSLRNLVCTSFEADAEEFLPMYSSSLTTEEFMEVVNLFREYDSWGSAMKLPVMKALADGLNRQIVVLTDDIDPIIFPANEKPISKDAIVLIKDSMLEHFDSTELTEQSIGSAVDQMQKLNRRIVPMPEDGNSFFNAVADQLQDKNLTAQSLRNLVCTSFEADSEEFLPMYNSSATKEEFTKVVKLFREDCRWGSAMKLPVMKALADGLNREIVVLTDDIDPIIFPTNGKPISKDAIILIKDSAFQHFDATELTEQSIGSAVDQMRKLNRRIVHMPEDDNSFFNAVVDQLQDKNLTAQSLRNLVCTSFEADSEEFLPMYSSSATTEEFMEVAKLFRKDCRWGSTMKLPVMKALADGLNRQIVLLTDEIDPIVFPTNEKPISKDAIVLIENSIVQHFDSTKLKDDAQNR